MSQNASSLFQQAYDDGDLTQGSLQVLQNIGAHFQAQLGTPAEQVTASEILVINRMIDNSTSVSRFQQIIRDGSNMMNEALEHSKQGGSVMMATTTYDGIINPFVMLDQAPRLDDRNYRATLGNTPLYDAALATLAATTAKVLEFASNGVPCRSVTVLLTDGANNSSKHSADDVKKVVEDLLRQENHIIAGVGVDDGRTDFEQVFVEMGLDKQWIKPVDADEHALREMFNVLSQSAVRASQGAASFSQAALGGFSL